jgi:hypothetical protein
MVMLVLVSNANPLLKRIYSIVFQAEVVSMICGYDGSSYNALEEL